MWARQTRRSQQRVRPQRRATSGRWQALPPDCGKRCRQIAAEMRRDMRLGDTGILAREVRDGNAGPRRQPRLAHRQHRRVSRDLAGEDALLGSEIASLAAMQLDMIGPERCDYSVRRARRHVRQMGARQFDHGDVRGGLRSPRSQRVGTRPGVLRATGRWHINLPSRRLEQVRDQTRGHRLARRACHTNHGRARLEQHKIG